MINSSLDTERRSEVRRRDAGTILCITLVLMGVLILLAAIAQGTSGVEASSSLEQSRQNIAVKAYVALNPLVEVVHVAYPEAGVTVVHVKNKHGEIDRLTYWHDGTRHLMRGKDEDVFVPGYAYETFEKKDARREGYLVVGLKR